jgi:hypothetical protein
MTHLYISRHASQAKATAEGAAGETTTWLFKSWRIAIAVDRESLPSLHGSLGIRALFALERVDIALDCHCCAVCDSLVATLWPPAPELWQGAACASLHEWSPPKR